MDQAWGNILADPNLKNYAAQEGITWTYITELAPWMGGFYERLIRLIKQSLKKTLGRGCVTKSQMHTLLTEVEAVVNSRPLVYVGADWEDGVILTPAHFLSLNVLRELPTQEEPLDDPDFVSKIGSAERIVQIWSKGQKALNQFWKVWRDVYLLSLGERTQSHLKAPRVQLELHPTVGDVVQIKDKLPRGFWRVGLIEELIRSKDGQVRAAKLRLRRGKVLQRALNQLYPLECRGQVEKPRQVRDSTSIQPSPDSAPVPLAQDSAVMQFSGRPVRLAARKAREAIKTAASGVSRQARESDIGF
jgi:hypothetical protein